MRTIDCDHLSSTPAPAGPAPPPATTRRSGNYGPTSWSHEFLESLASRDNAEHQEEKLMEKLGKFRKEVADLFVAESAPMALLELVDVVGQLGVAYLFEEEVKAVLDRVSANSLDVLVQLQGDLNAIALLFRIFRDNGYPVSQDVFNQFLDGNGKFKPYLLRHPKKLLSLYEASYYAIVDEHMLDEAKVFASAGLKSFLLPDHQPSSHHRELSPIERRKIEHTLELPIRWRMPRLHTRWFIDIYTEEDGHHSALLQLAKLDFIRLQIVHTNDLVELSRWWRKLALVEKMPFFRDRVVENFMFAMGMLPEPQFGYYRVRVAKMFCILTMIDDLYDVYGTLDELKVFTEFVERWDVNQIGQLPEYMKLCFLALFNDVNEVVYETLRDKGMDVLHYIKKLWADLCKAYIVEATWYNRTYIPNLDEYIENGWVSVAFPLTMPYLCALASENTIQQEAMEFICGYPDLVRWNSIICRLVDDMSTSVYENKRGDVTKAVECYMVQEEVPEDVARLHIHGLVQEAWKKINKERYNNTCFPKHLVEGAINLTRTMHAVYLYGDGFGFPTKFNKGQVMSLLVETLP